MDNWEILIKSAICVRLHLSLLHRYMLPSPGSAAGQTSLQIAGSRVACCKDVWLGLGDAC